MAILVGLGWAVAATAARAFVGLFTPNGPPLAFVFPAVLISTLQTGWLGGTVTLLGAEAASAFLYIPQLKTTDLGSMSSVERLLITFLIGLALLAIAQRHRDLGRRAAEAEQAAARAKEEAFEDSADRMRLLVHEVDHRANNLMTVIQGLVSLSSAPTAAELKRVIEGRLHALAKAHKLMSETRWQGADLTRLVTEELTPFGLGSNDRIQAEGDNVALSAAAAQGMALALHELATNAVKHGALSNGVGEVRVSWSCEDGVLKLRWEERGGPAVKKPGRSGTGLKVLQRAFEGGAEGRTDLVWGDGGLTCSFEVPLQS
jgi:two-component sensor histidine kinase